MAKKKNNSKTVMLLSKEEVERNQLYVQYKKSLKELEKAEKAGDEVKIQNMKKQVANGLDLLIEADGSLPLDKRLWKQGYRHPA